MNKRQKDCPKGVNAHIYSQARKMGGDIKATRNHRCEMLRSSGVRLPWLVSRIEDYWCQIWVKGWSIGKVGTALYVTWYWSGWHYSYQIGASDRTTQ